MLKNKKLWRCTVCNDLHVGVNPPALCPTCSQKNTYVEIEMSEFQELTKAGND